MTGGRRVGFAAGAGAFFLWGIFPLFWRLLSDVPTDLQLAHRVLWSFVLTVGILAVLDPKLEEIKNLRSPRLLGTMLLSTLLVGTNWFTFLWGVEQDRVREISLGYYTSPLLSVLLGRVVLKEHLTLRQAVAVALAATGVAFLAWSHDRVPWVSIVLATSFGLYGLVRKQAAMSALPGLVTECGLLAPWCAAYLAFGPHADAGPLFADWRQGALLLSSGAVTAAPLLLFAIGARRLRLSTVGMLQFLAPTLQLLLAVLVFGEPFTLEHGVTFGMIWAAIGLYATDVLRAES